MAVGSTILTTEDDVGMVTHEIVISSDDEDSVADARELAERIHRSADILLERLLAHLSQLPEFSATTSEEGSITFKNDTNNDNHEEESLVLKRGVTLPVSAVAWLADQLTMLDRLQNESESDSSLRFDIETMIDNQGFQFGNSEHVYDIEPWLGTEAAKSMRYRLNLLRFLLSRVQLIRLTRQSWPPKLSSEKGSSFFCLSSWRNKQRRRRSSSRQDNNETTQIPTETIASDFLRYAKRFEHGAPKYVNLLRAFPNATVLLLESVPTSWIDIQGEVFEPVSSSQNQSQPALQLISITNSAIYDLESFLPTCPKLIPSTIPRFQSSLSCSLKHLKLDNCSLGELTTGFASSLAQLVHLEYLSLRNNQFRSAKSLLRGLRPLIRLKYLDASANRLVGCFGPFANLCLGGQVRTLKLSGNLLTTCRNSGLEKCYALQEIWLDSNCIEDVVEVSGLARLPDLQCLALQRNPFSTRKMAATRLKSNTSPLSQAVTNGTGAIASIKNDTNSYENQCYDPEWKLRLWTWFQHERQAVTPLDLPVLNKKTKSIGFDQNGCDAAMIARMTRQEWDRVQEESYSIATTSSTTSMTSSSSTQSECTGSLTTERAVARGQLQETGETSATSTASQEATAAILTTNTTSLGTELLTPVRHRRVTKKSRTRQAKIHTTVYRSKRNDFTSCTEKPCNHKIDKVGRRAQYKKKINSSDCQAGEISMVLHNDALSSNHTTETKTAPIGIDALNSDSNATASFDKMKQINASEKELPKLSFSLQDVFLSLHHEHPQKRLPPNEENTLHGDSINDEKDKVDKESQSKEILPLKVNCSKHAAEDDVLNNPFLEDNSFQDLVEVQEKSADDRDDRNREPVAEMVMDIGGDDQGEDLKKSESSPLPAEDHKPKKRRNKKNKKKRKTTKCEKINDADHQITAEDILNTENLISNSESQPKQSPHRSSQRSPKRPAAINADRIFFRPKITSIKLKRMGHKKPFDALNSDWEDLVKRASEGRIPDGLPDDFTLNADLFSDNLTDLLHDENNEKTNDAAAKPFDQASGSRSTNDTTADPLIPNSNRPGNALPEHVWQDDNSVLSSLGASRDDILPREANKFQLAEENCTYDGPDSARGMKVVENLQLYFETFVFRTSMPDVPVDVLDELAKDHNDWQLIAIYYPRIQLWPDDRPLVELERAKNSSLNSADWTTNRERFLRVWKEDIVPCGKPALRRLPPNRRNRLGFHGDKLFENADVDAYAERRKVLLCLSSKAFYIILEKDDVTMGHQQQAQKRRFPLPLDEKDRFRDAPWPHSVARHCLGDLDAISIGFEFQRLILRFRNPSLPKSDPFVYVLLTGNKRASVRILQEIQKLAKDFNDNNVVSDLVASSSASTIPIENDSQIVLDSLNNLIENADNPAYNGQGIGTIMHYQIVQQQWKRGGRGTVRRVCVVTDTMILLLDEDYTADGHDVSSVTVKGKHMADVRHRLVDQAALSLVSQVQAAGSDPRAITIIINPSKLSRTHRWRLICRDREGAERLVEDARKALEDM